MRWIEVFIVVILLILLWKSSYEGPSQDNWPPRS
jgi:hypothetical protein